MVTGMRDGANSDEPPRPASFDPAGGVAAYIDDLRKTIALATALTKSGRQVDLAGLEHAVGVLCAKALDLMPQEGRALRPALLDLLQALDTLIAAMPPK